MNSIITTIGRTKMAQARAGIATLPPIVGIALGNGGVDSHGNVIEPGEAMRGELIRRETDDITVVTDTCYRYTLTLQTGELSAESISEMALYDADGDIVALKNFAPKIKDDDMVMIFQMDDQF